MTRADTRMTAGLHTHTPHNEKPCTLTLCQLCGACLADGHDRHRTQPVNPGQHDYMASVGLSRCLVMSLHYLAITASVKMFSLYKQIYFVS